MTPPILNLCARIETHEFQQRQLVAACDGFQQWDDLLRLAEKHGVAPLLQRHLAVIEEEIPTAFIRSLRFLSLRHQRENELRVKCLQYVLSVLASEGIPCLVLKGAALCQTLYPKVGLRPMSDIDLFFAKNDVQHAFEMLQKKGFLVSTEALPEGYYHLPPLCQNVDGLEVWVELHHGLFPELPPYYQPLLFTESYQNALSFQLEDGTTAYTFANEEMLWHLFQHGFHAPLTYETCRLIAVADIVSLVEDRVDYLDWNKLSLKYPQLVTALFQLHHVTPWSEKVLEKIPIRNGAVPAGVGEPFKGWPHVQVSGEREERLAKIVYNTFFPAQWWIMIYYSCGGLFSQLWCRLVRHPMHLLRWLKIYGGLSLKDKQ